jgi:integrase
MSNKNHPKLGSRTVVDPIRNPKDINSIKKLLSNEYRNLLIFTLGINNGLRIGDLLKLKAKDVKDLEIGASLRIRETKTGKDNILVINKGSHKVLEQYLDSIHLDDDDFLFPSRKSNNHLTVQYINNMVKSWARTINLKGNYGSHTLRKTFGYQQRTQYGVGWEIICKRFNHSSPAVTMRYLGIEDKEVVNILNNEI